MARGRPVSKIEHEALVQRLRDWIRQEQGRGIPMENILLACQECGIVPLPEEDDEEEIPEVTD